MTAPLPYGLVPQDILDARELFDDEVLGEEPMPPELTQERVIVSCNCDGGTHNEVHGDRWFFDGGDEEGYEEVEDALDAFAAYKASGKCAHARMVQADNRQPSERERAYAASREAPPAPPRVKPPIGLLMVAGIDHRCGAWE